MTRDDARRIVTQALFLVSKDKPDPELFRSPDVFGEFLYQAVRVMYPAHEVKKTDQLSVKLIGNDGSSAGAVVSFTKLFEMFGKLDVLGENDHLLQLVAAVGANIASIVGEDEKLELKKCVPILKSSGSVEAWLERNRERADELGLDPALSRPVHWQVNEALTAVLAVHQEDTLVFVTEDMRRGKGLSFDELKAFAMRNLRREYRAALGRFHHVGEMTEITGTGGSSSSFILVDGFLERLSKEAGDDLLVYSGGIDHLVIIPTGNIRSVAKALGGYAAGKLPAGDIPQMIYSEGKLRPVSRDDISALLPKVITSQPSSRSPHH
ncbi:hypothetical protein HFN89_06730 [Rhizobium laguerreae]|nr:hypothetical protein [Rhizobium laguerreae]